MHQNHWQSAAIYGIVLILVGAVVFSIEINNPTALVTYYEHDITTHINDLSEMPNFGDTSLTVNYDIEDRQLPEEKIIIDAMVIYPSGKMSYSSIDIQPSSKNEHISQTVKTNINEHGTYRLIVRADSSNRVAESNENNNQDEIIFVI